MNNNTAMETDSNTHVLPKQLINAITETVGEILMDSSENALYEKRVSLKNKLQADPQIKYLVRLIYEIFQENQELGDKYGLNIHTINLGILTADAISQIKQAMKAVNQLKTAQEDFITEMEAEKPGQIIGPMEDSQIAFYPP